VDNEGVAAFFTSFGPSSDGDVKPNVVALGRNTYLQRSNGTLGYSNGTSFASPVLAGAGACLWQANPQATAEEIKNAIEQSAHLYPHSDSLLGYGIPDMQIADQLLKTSVIQNIQQKAKWQVFPNPMSNYLIVKNTEGFDKQEIILSFYNLSGQLLRREIRNPENEIVLHNLHSLPTGLLILKIESENYSESIKLSKTG
jgi:hypothetical protein